MEVGLKYYRKITRISLIFMYSLPLHLVGTDYGSKRIWKYITHDYQQSANFVRLVRQIASGKLLH